MEHGKIRDGVGWLYVEGRESVERGLFGWGQEGRRTRRNLGEEGGADGWMFQAKDLEQDELAWVSTSALA